MDERKRALSLVKYLYEFITGLRLNCEITDEDYILNKAKEAATYIAVDNRAGSFTKKEINYWQGVELEIKKINSIPQSLTTER